VSGSRSHAPRKNNRGRARSAPPSRRGARTGLPKLLTDAAQILLGLTLSCLIAMIGLGLVVGAVVLVIELTK
jgi:hypothetical protein